MKLINVNKRKNVCSC